MKKAVLRNFAKFTGKQLFQSLEALAQLFSYGFCEIIRNTFFTEHLWTTASVFSKSLDDTPVKNYTFLNSAQEWLLLTFFICLYDQLNSIHFIITDA